MIARVAAIAMLLATPALAEPTVAVRLLDGRLGSSLQVAMPDGARLTFHSRQGQLWCEGHRCAAATWESTGATRLRVRGAWRTYPGRLRLTGDASGLHATLRTPEDTYVAGVVAAELPGDWPQAALEAQAVLARTLARRGGDHLGRAVCDLTHCQVYRGEATADARKAARTTRGLVLMYRGAIAQPLYHAACGGMHAANATVFGGGAVPYLVAGADPFGAGSVSGRSWRARVTPAELARALGRPHVDSVVVRDRDAGGWVREVEVDGAPMSGYRLWQALGRTVGWGVCHSVCFSVSREDGAFVFGGRGLGHGVGLCQWGARARAEAGWDFRRILAAYYPGTRVGEGS